MINKRLIFIILIIAVFIIILYTNTFFSNKENLIENIKVLKGPNIYGFDKKIELTINEKYLYKINEIKEFIYLINKTIGYTIIKIEIINNNKIVFDYYSEDISIEICNNIFNTNDKKIDKLKKSFEESKLGPSTKSIVDASISKNIPWERLNNYSLVNLGYGENNKSIIASSTEQTKLSAEIICKNKDTTKFMLNSIGVRCPKGYVVFEEKDLKKYFDLTPKPMVVKPVDGNQGKNVFINISNYDECLNAFLNITKNYKGAILEELFNGHDYRILIINYKFVAAAKRIPAFVIGNGKNTLSELIDIENSNPDRGNGHSNILSKIVINADTIQYLTEQNLKLTSIIPTKKIIYLCKTANLSTGGISENVTDIVHPNIINLCVRVAQQMQLDICGIDLIKNDITTNFSNKQEGIIEVNSSPGLRMHISPKIGNSIDVGSHIIDYLFPNNSNGRIPIISITGVNGKTTTTNLIASIFSEKFTVGKITTYGIYVDGELIELGDCTGYNSTKKILKNSKVQCAILETARGGILKKGIGYNFADVAVLTNIRNGDHIGKNFECSSVDDIIDVKYVVLENIKKNGWVVLNGNDHNTNKILNKLNKSKIYNIILFSIEKNDNLIQQFILENRPVVYYDSNSNNIVYEYSGNKIIFDCNKIPILEDKMNIQIENVLASISACISYGLDTNTINNGLIKFKNDFNNNPGRMNKLKYGNTLVLVDYAHNLDAFYEIQKFLSKTTYNKKIITYAPTGDRDDSVLAQIYKIIYHTFDIIILFIDDNFLRGRSKNSVINLINANMDFNKKKILIVNNEPDAIDNAFKNLNKLNNDVYICLLSDDKYFEKINEYIK
jgi:cyanophycin synthetase